MERLLDGFKNCVIGFEGTKIKVFLFEQRYEIGSLYYTEDDKYYYVLRLYSIQTSYPKSTIDLEGMVKGTQNNEPLALISTFSFACLMDLLDVLDKKTLKKVNRVILPKIGRIVKKISEHKELSELYKTNFEFKKENSNLFKVHCMVVGASGSGKSTFVKKLIEEDVLENYIIFDFHGEYPNSVEPSLREADVTPEIVSEFIDASLPQYELLNVCYKYFGHRWLSEAKNIPKLGLLKRMFQESTITVVRRHLMEISRLAFINQFDSVLDDIDKNLVINLKNYPLHAIELFILTVLHNIFSKKIPKTIVIEEAHNLRLKNTIIEKIFREGRKFSINGILVTQTPSILPSSITSNIGTMVCFRIQDKREFEFVLQTAPNLFISPLEIKSLDKLYGILISSGLKYPLRIDLQ